MRTPRRGLMNATSLPGIPNSSYSRKVQTFQGAPVSIETSGPAHPIGYGVFLSDRGVRTGFYSITSSQDAYRIINKSLLIKSGRL